MSDILKHECGIALIRLLKPLEYYEEKYGTALYGINKLYLLMEKQHNRGQDGAGVVGIKLNMQQGEQYLMRYRSNKSQPIPDIFGSVHASVEKALGGKSISGKNAAWLKKHVPFVGEVYLGHLRYGTYGKNDIESCHPFLRQNNWMTRNLALAGNFNLTNVDQLFDQLVELGQHPRGKSDTVTVLEKIGHFLDEENQELFRKYKDSGHNNKEISHLIADNIDIPKILKRAAKDWDGGYAIAGLIGHGDAFVMRDPAGIRPAYYYHDEEIAVVTSERPAIQTAFNIPLEDVREVQPGKALIIKRNGYVYEQEYKQPAEKKSCSFERIYFSRGSDAGIYRERKALGRFLTPAVLHAIDYDLENTVFSFIPNTAEVAFLGLIRGLEDYLNKEKAMEITAAGPGVSPQILQKILSRRPRLEKIAIKDAKLRTFITQDDQRDELVEHVYDITYGVLRPGVDTLVVMDDSIVRGTTLKKSILKILDRLGPSKIVIVSSAPQIRYPDCYGIDMARIGDLVAFRAAIDLLGKHNMEHVIDEVYHLSKEQLRMKTDEVTNHVKKIYKPFSLQQISDQIAAIVKPKNISADVEVIFQTIEDLHAACPHHKGDWYFTGNYPTPGGNRVVSRAFVNYIEGRKERAY